MPRGRKTAADAPIDPAEDRTQREAFRPEHTEEYPVPKAAAFKDDDGNDTEFALAPDLEALVRTQLDTDPYFSKAQDARIDVWWKRSSGMSKGKPIFGDLVRPGKTSLLRQYGGPDLILWLSAGRVKEYNLNRWQVEALVCSLLCRVSVNDEGNLGTVGPDFIGFVHEIERYGAWHPRMADLRAAIQPELPFQFETFTEPPLSDEPVDIANHRVRGRVMTEEEQGDGVLGPEEDAGVTAAFQADQAARSLIGEELAPIR